MGAPRPAERRADPRHTLDVLARYRSDGLELAGRTIDLSRGGVFIRADSFDAAGTTCEVELLPDAMAGATFRGRVCRVVRRGPAGQQGMAVQLEDVDEAQVSWLAWLTLETLRLDARARPHQRRRRPLLKPRPLY